MADQFEEAQIEALSRGYLMDDISAAALEGHRYDPETQRCTCGALDHPDWGVSA